MIIHKCDRCGHQQAEASDAGRQMWSIGIVLDRVPRQHNYTHTAKPSPQLWCEVCIAELGLKARSAAEPVSPPTLEDLVRELIDDELSHREVP